MTAEASQSLVIFAIDRQQFALPLCVVDKVVRAAEVLPLPGAPPSILGVVNIQGDLVPVYEMRRRFGLTPRPPRAADHIALAHTSQRTVGLLVDLALDVVPRGEPVSVGEMFPGLEGIESIVQLPDRLLLVQDLEKFLSADDERALAAALQALR